MCVGFKFNAFGIQITYFLDADVDDVDDVDGVDDVDDVVDVADVDVPSFLSGNQQPKFNEIKTAVADTWVDNDVDVANVVVADDICQFFDQQTRIGAIFVIPK